MSCKFLGLLAASFMSIAAAAHADSLKSIEERGVIRIAVPQDYVPFGGIGPDMQPLGYDVDTAKLVAEELGVKAELVPTTSANRIPYIQTNKVDLIISTLGKTAEREKVLDFSAPYAALFNGIFAAKGVAIKEAPDLSGKVVGVTRGTIVDIELTKMAPSDANIKRYEDENATIAAYLSGQVDAIGSVDLSAKVIAKKSPGREPEMKILINRSPMYFGVSKGETAMLEKLNEILTKAKTDGRLNAISQKWLQADVPSDL